MSAYENGRKAVDEALAKAHNKEMEARKYFELCDGAFNTSKDERDYDRGVYSRLIELGYEDPNSF